MNARRILGELLFPARSLASVLAMLVFALLIVLAIKAGILGLWLLVVVLPGLLRFLVMVADARAEGRDVEPPGLELFTLGGPAWTLFPVLPFVGLPVLVRAVAESHPGTATAIAFAGCTLLPAMTGVLVITHSPLQALNPTAWSRLVRTVGTPYLLAVGVLLLSASAWAGLGSLPGWLRLLFALYLLFAFHALVGGLLRERKLLDEIDVPEDLDVRASITDEALARERRICLDHAYGLFSRGNRDGALAYLGRWLDADPHPAAAYGWFLAEMLGWENRLPALYFGQSYLGWLLAQGESIAAVKLMLRLRLVDTAFKPAPGDFAAALAAARACGNADLAEALESPVS